MKTLSQFVLCHPIIQIHIHLLYPLFPSSCLLVLMILVDNVGRAFPSLNHSPWFGVTLADFIMPFFLCGWRFDRSGIQDQMYQRPVYIRKKECSVNSPDYGPLPPDPPGWCLAPFDPDGPQAEGILWSVFSFSLLLVGYILEILGMPLSKALYTLSYMCITAGASGLVVTAIYYIVDIEHLRKPTVLLQWMGMNALVVYALAACDIFPAVIQGFYWHSPENNLVDASEALMQIIFHSKRWGTLAFVIVEIIFWGLLAGFLHKKRIYIKL
uniref:Heparan-alpha-glucosaminide N-acetyltransferase catalytic domain-containing protein n=1 Tax=Glycine max TaxID=3847 RepID=A0A368UN36_SOYBN